MAKNDGKPRSAGKSKAKTERYFAAGRLMAKKLRTIICQNGYEEGVRWATVNKAEGVLNRFENEKNSEGKPLRWFAKAKAKAEERALAKKAEEDQAKSAEQTPTATEQTT